MASAKSKVSDMASGLLKMPKKTEPAKASAPFLSDKPEPPPAKGTKRRKEKGERLAIYVPPELAERLRIHCAKTRTSLSDAITRALEKTLP